jgi:hypothetical protein
MSDTETANLLKAPFDPKISQLNGNNQNQQPKPYSGLGVPASSPIKAPPNGFMVDGVPLDMSMAKAPEKDPLPKTLEDYEYLRITKEKDIPHPEPTVMLDEAAIAAPCNLLGISAPIKAGKTAIGGSIISGTLSEDGKVDGFPVIKCVPANGKAVLGFDTEQSEADHQDNVNTILRRAGLDKTPDNLWLCNIRQLPLDQFKDVTESICQLCSERFNGIHLIVVDGGADYIANTNDKDQSTLIIQYFTHLSIKYNCPVVIIVHLNPGSTKEQGHFGSELQRKCFGLITIEKGEGSDVSILKPQAFRKAGNGDVSPIHFTYDKEKHYHVQIDAPDMDGEKAIKERERHEQLAAEAFPSPQSYRHKDAVSRLMQVSNKKMSTCKTMLDNMVGWGYLEKTGEKQNTLYRKKT